MVIQQGLDSVARSRDDGVKSWGTEDGDEPIRSTCMMRNENGLGHAYTRQVSGEIITWQR
jgi:hypothetical protein